MYLNVPYHDKGEAKALGARWDGQRRLWYVPPGVDIYKFSRWNQEIAKWNRLADRGRAYGQHPKDSRAKPNDEAKSRNRVVSITGQAHHWQVLR